MSFLPDASGRWIILALATLIITWGLFSLADQSNTPYSGFGGAVEVFRVDEGGPANQAGMQVGDRVISRNGIPADDLRTLRRQPRAEIGEALSFVVERTDAVTGDTTTETLVVTFTAEPSSDAAGDFVGAVIGLVILFCGIFVYFRVPSQASLLFCVVCLCYGHGMFPTLYFSTFEVRIFMEVISMLIGLAMLASFLHFLLVFPKRKKLLEKAGKEKVIYLPAALLALIAIFNLISDQLNHGLGTVLARSSVILFLGYVVLSIAAIIHTFLKATPEDRRGFGLNFVLWSIIIGIAPLLLSTMFGILSPRISLPGADYYWIIRVLIPVAFAHALMKSGRPPAVVL